MCVLRINSLIILYLSLVLVVTGMENSTTEFDSLDKRLTQSWLADLRDAVVRYKGDFFPKECDLEAFVNPTDEEIGLQIACLKSVGFVDSREEQKGPVACTPECKAAYVDYPEREFPGCAFAFSMALEMTVKNFTRDLTKGPLNETLVNPQDAEILVLRQRVNQPDIPFDYFSKIINEEKAMTNITRFKSLVFVLNTNVDAANDYLSGCLPPHQVLLPQLKDESYDGDPVKPEDIAKFKSLYSKFRSTLVKEYGDQLPVQCISETGNYLAPSDEYIETAIKCREMVNLFPSPLSQCPAVCLSDDPEIVECEAAEDALTSLIANQWIQNWISQGVLPDNNTSTYGSQTLFASVVNLGLGNSNISDYIFDEEDRRETYVNDVEKVRVLTQYLLKDIATGFTTNAVQGCYGPNILSANIPTPSSGFVGSSKLVQILFFLTSTMLVF